MNVNAEFVLNFRATVHCNRIEITHFILERFKAFINASQLDSLIEIYYFCAVPIPDGNIQYGLSDIARA